MRRPDLPYLEFKTVKGRDYIYFRKGKFRRRLPSNPDSEDFSREYWACRSGKRNNSTRTTWDKLIISYYASPGFRGLSKGTQANYRRHCEAIREKNASKDMRAFRRKDALAVQAALQDTWSKANERIAVLSILCRHAVDLEWIERNPVEDIPKLKGGEYAAWPEDKLRAYERYCDEHGLATARTIYELMIGTGQRIGDCVAMEWADFDGEFMRVVQEKTGAKIEVFCPERLQAYLRALPRTGRHILAKNLTEHIGKRQAQREAELVRDKIGARVGEERLVQHGWRYTAAKELAEAGCSDAQIQAVTGHKTLAMVAKYRAQASQKQASKEAQQRRERNRHRT